MDRTSKIIFGAIAVGLWANLAFFLIRPPTANAADSSTAFMRSIDDHLRNLDDRVSGIYRGNCFNKKLC
jgi:hypothetical protein